MLYNFYIEVRRNFVEFYEFRVNILFANIGFAIMFLGILGNINQNEMVTVYLLFAWYLSLHGLDATAFIIEDEIMNRTLSSIISSKFGIASVLLIRNIAQLITDFVKAVIIFAVVVVVNNIDLYVNFWIILYILLANITMYFIGCSLGSFALVYRRISSICSVFYYFILFFSVLGNAGILSFIFPFGFLRVLIESTIVDNAVATNYLGMMAIQSVIYAVLAVFLMQFNLNKMYKLGKILYV